MYINDKASEQREGTNLFYHVSKWQCSLVQSIANIFGFNVHKNFLTFIFCFVGDVAFRILESINSIRQRALQNVLEDGLQEETQIYICDINPNMLNVGKKRAVERGIFQYVGKIWFQYINNEILFSLEMKSCADIDRSWRKPITYMGRGRCRGLEFR